MWLSDSPTKHGTLCPKHQGWFFQILISHFSFLMTWEHYNENYHHQVSTLSVGKAARTGEPLRCSNFNSRAKPDSARRHRRRPGSCVVPNQNSAMKPCAHCQYATHDCETLCPAVSESAEPASGWFNNHELEYSLKLIEGNLDFADRTLNASIYRWLLCTAYE